MDFDFTLEQTMLRDTLASFLADRYDFETRRKTVQSESGWRREIWRALAQELGILGAPFAEDVGGQGGGAIENSIVMEEFGKALVVEPWLGTVVIGGGVLGRTGGALAQELVAKIIAGDAVLAFAQAEPESRYNLADVTTKAVKAGGGYLLSGRKSIVIGAPWATHLLVTARSSGAQRDAGGVSLFLVETGVKGLRRQDYPTIDGGRASEVFLDGASGQLIGEEGNALPLIERAMDEASCALCAEAVGCMRRMLADTTSYATQRKQFGQPLAMFQVLAHRIADMFVALEQSSALMQVATLKLDTPERALAASAAKVQVGNAGKFLGQSAIQIHGGMGITEELALGHYFKRLTAISAQFGSVDHHLRRYADLTLEAVA